MQRRAVSLTAALSFTLLGACTVLGSSLAGFDDGATAPCAPPTQECMGACVDTTSSATHCGACGVACGPSESCVAGGCTAHCTGGQVACSGQCVQLANDPRHCGSCEKSCGADEVCGDGRCSATCPTGQTVCDRSCVELQTDPKNCGKCGNVCNATQECVASACVPACKTLLSQPIEDPWGASWDGLERAAQTWDEAEKTCEGFRGRLPTASELFRVSAVRSATVGQASHTNLLWSRVPYGPGSHVRTRLSDGGFSPTGNATATVYRCICPPPASAAFVGNRCNGPVAAPCVATGGESKSYNLDAEDRAPLHKGGAIWECAQARAHLASPRQLAEAIQAGVPGSGAWLHSADDLRFDRSAITSWTNGVGFTFGFTGNPNALGWSDPLTFRPFRCTGPTIKGQLDAGAGVPVGVESSYNGEASDTAATGYVAALDACWSRGGHLPYSTELGELIVKGLPNGSDQWLWTTDQTGFDGNNFTVAVKKWTGVDADHLYAYSQTPTATLTWSYKHLTNPMRPFRCIYYPVDAAYAGPPASSCATSCSALTLPGKSGAKMWIDVADRPAASVTQAVDACRQLGGHLPTQRDLAEAARQSVPGAGAFLLTSDEALGNQANLYVGVAKWTGAAPQFDDAFPNSASWANNAQAYRCIWTNELR